MIYQTFKLDLFPGKAPPTVHVSQNDHGTQRKLRAYLFLNGQPYTPPAGTTATVEGTDLLGRGFDAVSCTVGTNYVEFALTERMTCDAGPIRCKIELTLGSTVIGTGAFMLERDAAPVTVETILNDQSFIQKLAAALVLVIGQEAPTIAAATQDWLDDHPEATTTVQDGSITYEKLADGVEIEEDHYRLAALRRKLKSLTGTVRNNTRARRRYNDGQIRLRLVRDLNLCGVNYHVTASRYNQDTLHTPYSEGKTSYVGGVCITYKNGNIYGTQLALPNGTRTTFRRQLNRGVWGPWVKMLAEDTALPMAEDLDTVAVGYEYVIRWCRWDSGSNTANAPISPGSGVCGTYFNGTLGSQIALHNTSNKIWRRYYSSGAWTSWTLVAGG